MAAGPTRISSPSTSRSDDAIRFPGPALSVLWKTPQEVTNWPDAFSELAQRKPAPGDVRHLVPTTYAGPMKSLITDQWHLIVHKNLGIQLYDWVHDPSETNNLIQTTAGGEIARGLFSRLGDVLAGSATELNRTAVAITLHDGAFQASLDPVGAKAPVIDYYRLEAEAGSIVTVEVQTQLLDPAGSFDPVIAIEGPNRQPLKTCRNPGDDRIQSPGVADPTPDAFDDICVNDDLQPGVTTDSQLEILVPSNEASSVELQVRVSDWNGQARSGTHYQIAITGAGGGFPLVKAEAR